MTQTEEKINNKNEEKTDFENAIKLCGYGKFHYGFILICGLIFFCVGCQNGVNSYILPSAECDLNLKSEEKGFLNVAFLIGGVISALFWGVCADTYGRKKIIAVTLFIDAIMTFAASFSQTFGLLVVFRALSGFTIGAPGSLICTYLGEFHSSKHRVKAICYVGFFWTLSWLVLPALAWIIIPLKFSFVIMGLHYNSWRFFLAIIGFPSFIMSLIIMTYPESPKFLLSQGKNNKALKILKKIYTINMNNSQLDYPVKCLFVSSNESSNCQRTNENIFKINDGPSSFLFQLLKNAWTQVQALASPPLSYHAIICWTIYFTNMFGYYGFGLWMPELFNRFDKFYKQHPNVTSVSVCNLVALNETTTTTTLTINKLNCNHQSMDQQVFIDSLIINAVCLIGNLLSGFFADRLERRTMPVLLTFIAGISGIGIYFVNSSRQLLLISCLFSLTISTANFVISSIVVDIFPTYVGALAICLMTCFGRIGAIASNLTLGYFLDINCEIPIFLVAGIVMAGAVLSLLLPSVKT